MAQTVIGIFDSAEEARTAISQLQSSGISRDRVDIRENSGSQSANNDRNDADDNNGIGSFFRSLFSDDDDRADRYARVGHNSRCIVTVHAGSSDEAERAADILDSCGAVDVDERSAQYGSVSSDRTPGSDQRREASIPRVEENLEVGKRTQEGGGVRVRSRIVERPVEEHVRLREEHVQVDRQSVDRPASAEDLDNFKETSIELTERSEVPVVNKEARVVEEIRVSKEVTERDETIRDTVRKTEVDIDRLDDRDKRDSRHDSPGRL